MQDKKLGEMQDKKFPRLGFETSPMGPGFETFPNQFHFNISQMWQPSFQKSAPAKLP